jgi:hypothetical protein
LVQEELLVQEEPEVEIFHEKDEINPNQVVYDLENDEVFVPMDEDIMTTPLPSTKKIISRNIGNIKRRRSR